MPWLYLAIAIVLELCGTTCMKLSAGFTRPLPSVLIFVFYAGSFTSLTLALKGLPLGLAYAIWSGVGTAAVLFIGNRLFGEPLTPSRLFAVALIITGIVWLHLSAPGPSAPTATDREI